MALLKSIPENIGVSSAYHRIIEATVHYGDGQTWGTIGSYVSEDARRAMTEDPFGEKTVRAPPIAVRGFRIAATPAKGQDLREFIYDALRSGDDPFWADAKKG